MVLYKDGTQKIEVRVNDLMKRMTIEEKIAQTDMSLGIYFVDKVHPASFVAVAEDAKVKNGELENIIGNRGMGFIHSLYTTPEITNEIQRYFMEKTRLGIPVIFLCEALHGLSMPDATPFPIPLALASSFNRKLVERTGRCIAKEAYVTGHREVLNPNLDIAREPRWGRMEETFGEDVCLASEMAYSIVSGLQGESLDSKYSVGAEPKHFVAHGIAEGGLNSAPARAGKREVEICYIPVFEAAVKKGKAVSVMASYNCIDGEPVMSSHYYLTDVLKKRLNLKGYVRSDFGGIKRLHTIHKTKSSIKEAIAGALNAGLDTQGVDFSSEVWQSNLFELYKEGELSQEVIDDAARRILTIKFEMGLFDRPYTDDVKEYKKVLRGKESLDTAYEAARESICLLKNNDKLLPVNKESFNSISVIGPFSDDHQVGGYSPVAYSYKHESVYEVLKHRFKTKKIFKAYGCSADTRTKKIIPVSWFEADGGVTCEYYSDGDYSDAPVYKSKEQNVDFVWFIKKPYEVKDNDRMKLKATGRFKVDISDFTGKKEAEGRLFVSTKSNFVLKVDDCILIDSSAPSANENKRQIEGFEEYDTKEISADFLLIQDSTHKIEIELEYNDSCSGLSLGYELKHDQIDEAVAIARKSDMVFLVCGDSGTCSGEGNDRSSLNLPGKQHELIRSVFEVNKNVVLILQTGRPVVMDYEKANIPVIIQEWFSGEKGAEALVDMIFGKFSPSGKTPISWPKSVGHIPSYYTKLPGTTSPMYHDSTYENVYEFGYGLSYTEFKYSNLRSKKIKEYEYIISFDVENIGQFDGKETAQMYVEDVYSSVVTPRKVLKEFSKIHLKRGEKKTVSMKLGFDSFKLLNSDFEWVIEPGMFNIYVGASSKDIRLEISIEIS